MNREDWLAKVEALPRDAQAKLGVMCFIRQAANSKAPEMIKANAMLKALEFYELFTRKQAIRQIVEAAAQDIESLPPKDRAVIAEFLLALAELGKKLPVQRLKTEMLNMQMILKEDKPC